MLFQRTECLRDSMRKQSLTIDLVVASVKPYKIPGPTRAEAVCAHNSKQILQ